MTPNQPTSERWWTVQQGPGPIIATAIHDGHDLRSEIAEAMKLSPPDRMREEDPFTGQTVQDIPTHIIGHRSRFEFDLNRGEKDAIYVTPEQAWGLDIWHQPLGQDVIDRSLALHKGYYRMLGALLDTVADEHERFVVLDVHSYNHRRDGAGADPTPQDKAPDINIGTFSMPRMQWAFLMDPLIEAMAGFDFNGRKLDVRENIAFQGKGEQTRFIHERYPGRACAIAIEFKKFFMDEWSGEPDQAEVDAMRRFINFTADKALELLK